jgi:tRNA(fMet)-specific endonuclease VapC
VSLWIFDTDCLTLFQHGQRQLVERVARLPREQVTTTIVTLEEQVRGRFNLVRRAETVEQLVNAYQRLQEAIVFFSTVSSVGIFTFSRNTLPLAQRAKVAGRKSRFEDCCNRAFNKWNCSNSK